MGTGFAGGLLRQAPDKTTSHSTKSANNANKVAGYSEGNNHSLCRLSCIPSRKAECAAMWDLIRGSSDEYSRFSSALHNLQKVRCDYQSQRDLRRAFSFTAREPPYPALFYA